MVPPSHNFAITSIAVVIEFLEEDCLFDAATEVDRVASRFSGQVCLFKWEAFTHTSLFANPRWG